MNSDCRSSKEGTKSRKLFGMNLLVVEDDGNADNCMLCVLLDWCIVKKVSLRKAGWRLL